MITGETARVVTRLSQNPFSEHQIVGFCNARAWAEHSNRDFTAARRDQLWNNLGALRAAVGLAQGVLAVSLMPQLSPLGVL